MNKKYFILLPYLSALLLGLPFVNNRLSFLGLVGFVPIVIYLGNLRGKTSKFAYLNLFFALFLFEAIVLAWMLAASPSRWLPIPERESMIMSTLVWLHTTVLMSSGYGLFVLMAKWLNKQKLSEMSWIFALCISWGIAEFLRAFITSVGLAGQDSVFGPFWNHGSLGYLTMNLPIAFGSRFVGLYGMSIGLLLINFGIYKLLKQSYRSAIYLILPVLLVSTLGFSVYSQDDKTLEVSAVHVGLKKVDNNPSLDFDQFDSEISNKNEFDLIVFPEGIDPASGDKPIIRTVSNHVSQEGAIVAGRRQRQTYPSENLQVYFNSEGKEISSTKKWFIVPYGEYVPYIVEKLISLAGMSDLVDTFRSTEQIIAGQGQAEPVNVSGTKIGGQVCSGISVPAIYHFSSRNGAEILTNSASLSHLAYSPQYHQEAFLMAKYHAVSNSRPFVQSTRSGQSLILSADGEVLSETSSTKSSKIISAEVQTRSVVTFASWASDYVLLLASAPLLFLLYRRKGKN